MKIHSLVEKISLSKISIPRAVIEEISRHSIGEFPRESVGALFYSDTKGRWLVRRFSNIAPNERQYFSFQVSAEELLSALSLAERWSLQLKAFYHSHPFGSIELSRDDLSSLFWTFSEQSLPLWPKVDIIVVALRRPFFYPPGYLKIESYKLAGG